MSQLLAKKVAIVTGASSGIGLTTVKSLLKAGASVLGVDMAPLPESVPLNHSFAFHQVDITAANAASEIAEKALSSFPSLNRIDILVNNAGIIDTWAGVATHTDEVWERVMSVNLEAPTRLMREAVKIMKKQKSGNIVNVASTAAFNGGVGGVAYTASKHGLLGVTKNTAWVYKDDGIRCNVICPGSIITNIGKTVDWAKVDHEAFNTFKPVHACHMNPDLPGEGVLKPETCAQAILFLSSELSSGITGAVVPVDHGFSVI